MEFWLPYGGTEIPVAIPDENLLGYLRPLEGFTGESIDAMIPAALQCRVGDRTLLEAVANAKKTVVVFNAKSALCTLVANLLTKELVKANGEGVCMLESAPDPAQPRSSRPLPENDLEAPCLLTRHDPKTSPTVKVGQLEDGVEVLLNENFAGADVRCVVTGVAVSSLWGYSGGPSLVVPGLASEKTIKASFRPMLRSSRMPGVLSGNPMYEAILRASQMARVDFAIHFTERVDGEVAGVFAGDFLGTFEQACALTGKMFRPPLQRRADIVISSAGGGLWDRTLFDAIPAAIAAGSCCKDRGIIILVAECADGLGQFAFAKLTVRDSRARSAQIQRGSTLDRLVEYSLQKLAAEHRVYLVSTLPERQVGDYGLQAAKTVGNALQRAVRHAGKDATVALMPHGSHTAPLLG